MYVLPFPWDMSHFRLQIRNLETERREIYGEISRLCRSLRSGDYPSVLVSPSAAGVSPSAL